MKDQAIENTTNTNTRSAGLPLALFPGSAARIEGKPTPSTNPDKIIKSTGKNNNGGNAGGGNAFLSDKSMNTNSPIPVLKIVAAIQNLGARIMRLAPKQRAQSNRREVNTTFVHDELYRHTMFGQPESGCVEFTKIGVLPAHGSRICGKILDPGLRRGDEIDRSLRDQGTKPGRHSGNCRKNSQSPSFRQLPAEPGVAVVPAKKRHPGMLKCGAEIQDARRRASFFLTPDP
jgi:hypothetical protein